MCLPYYKKLGWNPVIITVKENYIDCYTDNLLTKTFPTNIEIHKVDALPVKTTRKFGLGSLSIRSFFQIMKKGNQLLKRGDIDLIFFSTTAFHVLRLGPYWKKKFGIPFVVDIQDPWRNDYYLDKPKNQRPPKFYLNYLIDKKLETSTIPKASGIISVSNGYIEMFKNRYPEIHQNKYLLLPFCSSSIDFDIANEYVTHHLSYNLLNPKNYNILYIGRGGFDLNFAIEIIFTAFKNLKERDAHKFNNVKFIFAGTSYAPEGKGCKTIEPIAEKLGIKYWVIEMTDRIPYFEVLSLLPKANLLFVPGSIDTSYTASKIYPYILSKKPILSIFNEKSSVVSIIKKSKSGVVIEFGETTKKEELIKNTEIQLENFIDGNLNDINYDSVYMENNHSSEHNTKMQTDFFNDVVNHRI
jgi:hypothetical protein